MSQTINVSVKKLTDVELMRLACEATFLGTSHQSLMSIYKSEHSPSRTQMFWISVEEYYLANLIHLVRHHVGLQPFMMTSRNDRSGHKDKTTWIAERLSDILSIPEEHRKKEEDDELHLLLHELKTACGRKQPTSLSILVNAQSLIDMAKLRLCKQSSPETIALFNAIKEAVKEIDSDLSEMMVAKCIYRNRLCGEPRCCEYNSTPAFQIELDHYLSFYTNKQKGINERKKA